MQARRLADFVNLILILSPFCARPCSCPTPITVKSSKLHFLTIGTGATALSLTLRTRILIAEFAAHDPPRAIQHPIVSPGRQKSPAEHPL